MGSPMSGLSLAPQGDRPISAEDVAAFRRHPGFTKAMRQSAETSIRLHRGGRLLGWLLGDRARAIFGHAVIYLDATYDPADPRSGLTVSRVRDLCSELRLCSPGRAAAMLALMRVAGFVAPADGAEDGRVHRLVPTEKLLSLQRARLVGQLQALVPIVPHAAEALALIDEPRFARQMVLGIAGHFLDGFRVLMHAPELRLFAERSTGMVILFDLLLKAGEDGERPVDLSIADLSRRFEVSRVHIIRLLRDAEAQGLVTRTGVRGETLIVTPACRSAAANMLATILVLFRNVSEAALETFREG